MPKKRFGNELHPLYKTWLSINQRCNNPKSTNYHKYGARGIFVCDDFKDFKFFAKYIESLDGYEYKELKKLTIDRIDNNDGYRVGNLRLANHTEQTINSRKRKDGKCKYVGVYLNSAKTKYTSCIKAFGKNQFLGNYFTQEEAVIARNNYILKHKLDFRIQTI